ncbi:kinase-like protein, partial [Punctularia strigosozonata HHB-11173 SS5]|uniref:kinase-like protein n=1 Tax=Punctularia strigosozonata (strain HHB-11173) TaxID=741275 RepID=UPI000441797B
MGEDAAFRHGLARTLVRIVAQSRRLPSNFFIHGVQLHSRDSVASGGFGDIFKGSYLGKEVAVKRLRVRQKEGQIIRLYREIIIWLSLDHPHVLPFYGVDGISFSPLVCMVSPWMHNGSLLQYIQKVDRSNLDVDKLLYQSAQGMDYLHSRSIVHGDIRCSNIFIDRGGYAKLADFGLSII